MKVIPPLTLTSAMLTSSVAEPDAAQGEAAWAAATSYAIGDVVARPTTHRLYKCAVPGADAGLPEATPTRWVDMGPTNKWAMVDLMRNSQTVSASTITLTLTPGKRINSLFFGGLEATSITVTGKVLGATVYSKTADMRTRKTTTWTEYFFGSFRYQPSFFIGDLPLNTALVLEVSIANASGPVKVGSVVLGMASDMGRVLAGARNDGLNFSRIERDEYGGAVLVPRRTVPRTTQQIVFERGKTDRIKQLREDLNAVPALWIGIDGQADAYYESLLILGVYKRFELSFPGSVLANLDLELEEI